MVFEREIAAAEAAASRAAAAAEAAQVSLRLLHEQEAKVAQWSEPPRSRELTVLIYVDFLNAVGEPDSMIVRCWSWDDLPNWQYACPNISARGLLSWPQMVKALTGGPKSRQITGIDVVSGTLVLSLAEYLKRVRFDD